MHYETDGHFLAPGESNYRISGPTRVCVQITAGPSVYDSLRLAFDDMETADVRYTVCPGSNDPPKKYSNIFASEN